MPTQKNNNTADFTQLAAQLPQLLQAYQRGEINQRFLARSLDSMGFSDLLLKDMSRGGTIGATLNTLFNAPKGIALTAKTQPFVNEVSRIVRNKQNAARFYTQKQQASAKVKSALAQIASVRDAHAAQAQSYAQAVKTYNNIARKYRYDKSFKDALEKAGVTEDMLPEEVAKRMREHIEAAKKNRKISSQRYRKWSQNPNNFDNKAFNRAYLKEVQGAQRAQSVYNKAISTAQLLNKTKFKAERPVDSGKAVDLSILRNKVLSMANMKNSSSLLDFLKKVSISDLKREVKETRDAAEVKRFVKQYINEKLRGVSIREDTNISQPLLDVIRYLIDNS